VYILELQRRYGDIFTLKVAGNYMTFVLNPINAPIFFKAQNSFSFEVVQDEIAALVFAKDPAAHTNHEMKHELHKAYASFIQPHNITPVAERLRDIMYDFLVARNLLTRPPTLESATSGWRTDDLWRLTSECLFTASSNAIYGDGFCSPHDMSVYKDFEKFDKKFPLLMSGFPFGTSEIPSVKSRLYGAVTPDRPNASNLTQTRIKIMESFKAPQDQRAAAQLELLWASQGNAPPTAFWTLYHVCQDPKIARAIIAEYASAFNQQSHDGLLNLDVSVMRRLLILDSAILEALRLYSSVMLLRRVVEDCHIEVQTTFSQGYEALRNRHQGALPAQGR